MQIALSIPDIKVRGSRNLDADLMFCRTALAWGRFSRDAGTARIGHSGRMGVEHRAQVVKSLLTKMQDAEGLDLLVIQLAEVQRGLNNSSRYLDIPPVAV